MSTYMYLQCQNHNPPLQADEESGQHYYHLKQIFADLKNRDTIIAAAKENMWSEDYFRIRTQRFLIEHPHCDIKVISEYGEHMTENDIPNDEHL